MKNIEGYSARQVCKITGVEYSTLDYWDRAGFIKPSASEATGTGSKRVYSFLDLIALKVALSLRENGVTLQTLRKVVDYLRSKGDSLEHPLTGTVLITDGKKVFEVTNDKEILVDLVAGGQLVRALALDKVVSRLERRAKRVMQKTLKLR
ncbi:MAG: MerR family transcriptional regulator [Bacillota bacterium]